MKPTEFVYLEDEARDFYKKTMALLMRANVPFLVGGAYAFNRYTEIVRHTKDFDVFVRRTDYVRALTVLEGAGYVTEVTDDVWIAKAFHLGYYVDFIFGSANAFANVDELWFEHSIPSEVLDTPVLLVPPEEMIWQKAFILERDRCDTADVAHLFLKCADKIDWTRLLSRFDKHWRALLAHLILYGLVYPAERDRIPSWLMDELLSRLELETHSLPPFEKNCLGTLFSRSQYTVDMEIWGYNDGRPIARSS
jgi:hypothetical protein